MTERDEGVRSDPIDGLPATPVGEWAIQKHQLLALYIEISRAARKNWVGPGKAGATYIDPFCAAGRAYIRETGEFIDGSPLVAWSAAQLGVAPFTSVFLNDQEVRFSEAAATRLRQRKAPVAVSSEDAGDFIDRLVPTLRPSALHLVFIDPFDLKLPFSMIQRLATLKRIDLLIHVSAMDLQRNWQRYSGNLQSPLDTFNPGWRARLPVAHTDKDARFAFVHDWVQQLKTLGFRGDLRFELIRGAGRKPLYWLVLVAKHELATKFWDTALQSIGTPRLL